MQNTNNTEQTDSGRGNRQDSLTSRVREFLTNKPGEQISNQDIAAAFDISSKMAGDIISRILSTSPESSFAVTYEGEADRKKRASDNTHTSTPRRLVRYRDPSVVKFNPCNFPRPGTRQR